MTNKKQYHINQSPFYKLSSHDRLAKILFIKLKTLNRIIYKGDDNYYFAKLSSPSSRNLEVPKSQLKRIHSRINTLISRIHAPEFLFSGVKGRSNIKNAEYHAANTALIKIDIEKYYLNTTIKMVERAFVKYFKCSKDVSKTLARLCTVQGHLPTGSPISQSLSFYTNIGIFNHLNIYSKSRNIKFSVYVDDLTFSGKVIPKDFIHYVTTYINKNRGYDCHKIRRFNASTIKVVTGAVIDGDILKVKSSQRKKIQELLHGMEKMINSHPSDSPELVKYLQILIGHLFSAGQVNGRYYQKGKEIVSYRKDLAIKSMN